jgi:hypothetical protein
VREGLKEQNYEFRKRAWENSEADMYRQDLGTYTDDWLDGCLQQGLSRSECIDIDMDASKKFNDEIDDAWKSEYGVDCSVSPTDPECAGRGSVTDPGGLDDVTPKEQSNDARSGGDDHPFDSDSASSGSDDRDFSDISAREQAAQHPSDPGEDQWNDQDRYDSAGNDPLGPSGDELEELNDVLNSTIESAGGEIRQKSSNSGLENYANTQSGAAREDFRDAAAEQTAAEAGRIGSEMVNRLGRAGSAIAAQPGGFGDGNVSQSETCRVLAEQIRSDKNYLGNDDLHRRTRETFGGDMQSVVQGRIREAYQMGEQMGCW